MKFEKWLDEFMLEKGIDLEETFTVDGKNMGALFDYGYVIDCIKYAEKGLQENIKKDLVKIDFMNLDVRKYLRVFAEKVLMQYYE